MKEALDIVKVDPQSMIVECNRIMDIIDEKRDSMFEKEKDMVQKFFNLGNEEAIDFTHNMVPNNSEIYRFEQEYYDIANKYLTKCIQSLESDIKMSILREDYNRIVDFE